MNMVRTGFILCLLGIAAFTVGCESPRTQDSAALAAARAEVYTRDKVEFAHATLHKPIDSWTDELGVKLAPLLMEEVRGAERKTFGHLVSDGGKVTVSPSKPTAYFTKDEIWIKGVQRDQAVFLWFYQDAGEIVPQGVRITLDSDGHPAIWEILNDRSGVRQIFVSRSLEAAAASQFGAALPNRSSSLEQSVADAPNVVVSRVISDGPMAMGPAIYLEQKKHDVATLICRCMPPQAKEVTEATPYEILNMSDPATENLVSAALRSSNVSAKHWLNEGAEEMEMHLRLPDKF